MTPFYPPTQPGDPIAPLLRGLPAEHDPDTDPTCWRCHGAPVDEASDEHMCTSCEHSIQRRYP